MHEYRTKSQFIVVKTPEDRKATDAKIARTAAVLSRASSLGIDSVAATRDIFSSFASCKNLNPSDSQVAFNLFAPESSGPSCSSQYKYVDRSPNIMACLQALGGAGFFAFGALRKVQNLRKDANVLDQGRAAARAETAYSLSFNGKLSRGFNSSELKPVAVGGENRVLLWEHQGEEVAIRLNKYGQPLKPGEYEDLQSLQKYGGPKIYPKTTVDGQEGISMEYIKGQELKKVERVTGKQCHQIQSIVEKSIVDNVVLSDIGNPRNILISSTGDVRLIDNRVLDYNKMLAERRAMLSRNYSGKELEERILSSGHSPESTRRIYGEFIQRGGEDCKFLQPLFDNW